VKRSNSAPFASQFKSKDPFPFGAADERAFPPCLAKPPPEIQRAGEAGRCREPIWPAQRKPQGAVNPPSKDPLQIIFAIIRQWKPLAAERRKFFTQKRPVSRS
jgi:hypothetical protein